MTRTERALAGAVLAVVLGCRQSAPSAPPRPVAAEPAQGFEQSEALIDIVGSAFHVRAVQRVHGGSSVDASYRAWLGTTELRDVVWLDPTRLRARVPAGLPRGFHDLRVAGPYGEGTAGGAYEVLPGSAPSLSASLSLVQAASVGQEVLLEVTVENGGDFPVEGVLPEATLSGPGALALVAPAAPQDLAPGARSTLTLAYRAEAPGAVSVSVSAIGRDPRTGAAVVATATGGLRVERPAALSAALALPPGPLALGDLPVTLTVTNTGEATAVAVVPASLVDDGSTGAVVVVSGPTQAVTLAAGESVAFAWSCRAVAAGTLALTASVTGADANDGRTLRASVTATTATVPHGLARLASDPFADGSTFAFVAPYRGQVYVGPSRTGDGVVRMQRDGTGQESLALTFPRDPGVGSTSSSAGPWPHMTLGYTGCTAAACGPDGEDGRGLLTSVSFAGDEWLVLGGARSSGELDYVYLSRASASPLDFSYVDLSTVLGANTRGVSAALGAGGRLYLGFPDNGGSRPYGIALLRAPTAPGLDAAQGTDALDLGLHDAYNAAYGGFTAISIVDAMAELGGRVYFFDDVGCLVATGQAPATKSDFLGCSPATSAAYDRKQSVAPPRQFDLEPPDKAWPQAVAWNGRLYAIRNTTTGPQLWSCDPAGGADPAVCDPTDWTLLAADAAYRTRLGYPGVTAASMLLATPSHLYLGLDDPGAGLHVFRTRAALPAISDFTGLDGCAAGTPGCQGLGGDGLGTPALTHILDAKLVSSPDGRTDLFFTARGGSSPFQLIRMDP
ncbi:DUF11 domain-containing protein [Anaeromyxobacter sp. SG66]|uniref:DUF11 domain-containing protein n=1 Tax=Anaeromyxobacter sp. SG66 TaxID=2925410 RepID=UPI001F59B1D9|nr:DUF11 domain-containing protein [Anaeromyxobacter sp. SG66]